MKKRATIAAVATLGLAAVAATPAMAFENEFHGAITVQGINSNFNRTATTDYGPGDGNYDPSGTTKKQYSSNFVEQRVRLQYTAKASEDLKLVTQFELDYAYWGNSAYTVARNGGAALGADTVNIETKHLYLDANPFKGYNLKLGMMANTDAYKGTIFDADMAGGILSVSAFGKFTPTIGYYRFNDTSNKDSISALGKKTRDMFMVDGKFQPSEKLKLGASYYLVRDNTTGQNDKINMLGVNAEFTTGNLTLSGFAVYQTGWNDRLYVNSFSGNLGAALKVGPGTARAEFLYVMGSSKGRSSYYAIDGEHGYYNNEMVILGRDKNAMTTDNAIIFDAGNKGQGQMGIYAGYDLPVTEKLTTAFNLGLAGIAHKNDVSTLKNIYTKKANGSNLLGTEINAEATYTVLKGLTAGVRVGYVFLGGYYNNVATNGTPVNPYDAKVIVKYTF